MSQFIIPFADLTMQDLPKVGGKNASLGEMIRKLSPLGLAIPNGYAITVAAFDEFLSANNISDVLTGTLQNLDHQSLANLSDVGKKCREIVMLHNLPQSVEIAVREAHASLVETHGPELTFAVRSSATAEDSPTASFAGQHESFLNVNGIEDLLLAVKRCYASLFNDRAIKYRIDNGFEDMEVRLSVGVQIMVRSDKGSAGVVFTIEPENGNENLIYITGAWGLGESVVQGAVNTDEFYVFKPALASGKNGLVHSQLGSKEQMLVYGEGGQQTLWKQTSPSQRDQFVLDSEEINRLGKWCAIIEKHYGMPMDIEWAKDGITQKLYIVQARPETVHNLQKKISLKEYSLNTSDAPILSGKAIGSSIVSGKVRIVKSLADGYKVEHGDIIVADITNPDWNALLRRAICIVTNKGGRTSHASIVARELGISAVVGTGNATEVLQDGQVVTVSCANGDLGLVYNRKLEWSEREIAFQPLQNIHAKPMLILSDPQKALFYASYPSEGVGLLRMEFTISNTLQIHPMALVKFQELPNNSEKKQIEALTRHYADKKQFFIDKLAESIGLVAAAFYPREVIVRMSDFKTNEYAKLLGGRLFEPHEENPMLGFRGASRYYNERYREGFGLECAAVKKVREDMMLTNVKVMIPFCRTLEEGKKVLDVMRNFGLERGAHGLEVYVMAEIPSNILLAKKFAELFDGFSIGSNDLTQLTLGLDRDSEIVSDLFNENNDAIKIQIERLITRAHEQGVKVGLCGQAPSDYPEFAAFLVQHGIDSISFNPDALIKGIENIASAERTIQQTADIS